MQRAPRLAFLLPAFPLLVFLLVSIFIPQRAQARVAPEGLTVRGVALGPEGEPVTGQAALIPLVSSFQLARFQELGQARPPAVDTARLGADGGFLLKAPEPGFWVVAVEGRGMRTVETTLQPLTGNVDLPSLRLQPAEERTVIVQGADGEPVPSALVLGQRHGSYRGKRSYGGAFGHGAWQSQMLLGRTDERGRVRLAPMEGDDLQVFAWAPGFLPSEGVAAETRTVTVPLVAGEPRTVRVLGADGRPAEGVLIEIGPFEWAAGRTDEEGRATFAAPSAEALDLVLSTEEVRMRGLSLLPLPDRENAEEERSEEQDAVFTLDPARALEATVVDEESGRELPGAVVWWGRQEPSFCRTGSSGVCSLTIQSRDDRPVSIRAVAGGYRAIRRQAAPTSSSVRLPLSPAVELRGRIFDGSGAPVAGAEVSASGSRLGVNFVRGPAGATARTAGDGSFLFSDLDPRESYLVSAKKTGFAPGEVEVVTPDPGEAAPAVEIVLQGGALVFGHVLDETGAPVVGAEVQIQASEQSGSFNRSFRSRRRSSRGWKSATTDEEGRFEARDLGAGSYGVWAVAPGHAPGTVQNFDVTEGAGPVDVGSLILVPGARLEGRVTDRQGIPVEGAQVRTHDRHGVSTVRYSRGRRGLEGVSTDVDGRFVVPDLAPDSKVVIWISKEGYADVELPGVPVPGESPLEVVLEETFAVQGRILDPDGRPVADARAMVSDGAVGSLRRRSPLRNRSRLKSARSDADGAFVVEGLASGTYVLAASAAGFQTSEEVEVVLGKGSEEEDYTLVLAAGADLSGRVFTPGGQGAEGSRVWIRWDQDEMLYPPVNSNTVTDANGDYVLAAVPTGTLTVMASHPEYAEASQEVQVQPEGRATVDLTLQPGYEVSGQVVTDGGEPVVGAEVRLREAGRPRGRRSKGVVSGLEGRFTFEGVASGRYDVEAMSAELPMSRPEEVEVLESSVAGVELVLSAGVMISGRVTGLAEADLATVKLRAFGGSSGLHWGRVNPDGSYQLGPVAPGKWTLQATVQTTRQQASEEVLVEAGTAEVFADITFSQGHELKGRVVRGDESVRGAWVRLRGIDVGSAASGKTNYEGDFHLVGLEEGDYWLEVTDTEVGTRHFVEVTVGGPEPLEIEMPSAAISGIVRSAADGAPLPLVEVEALTADAESGGRPASPRSTVTNGEGRFRLESFAAGQWRVTARKEGFAPEEHLVTVREEGVSGLELTLQETEGLWLDVVLPDGRPALGANALLFGDGGNVVARGTLRSDDGRFHLDTAPPGRWWLQLGTDQREANAVLAVEVPGSPVTVRMPATGWLDLRVPILEVSRMPASVAIRSGAGVPYLPPPGFRPSYRTVFSLQAGKLQRQPLPPGTWHLTVTAADGTSWTGSASIQSGAAAEVILD